MYVQNVPDILVRAPQIKCFFYILTFALFTAHSLRYTLWAVLTYVQNVPDILVRFFAD